MIRLLPALYLSLILWMPQNSMAAKMCADIFAPFKISAEIQKSIDLSIADLAKMRLSLDLRKVHGGNPIEFTASSASYAKKEKELLTYLEKYNIMTGPELFEKIKAQIKLIPNINKETKAPEEKKQIREDIARMQNESVDGSMMVFNRVNPGSFKMGYEENEVDVTISDPFEMMATPVTQIMWKKIVARAEEKWPNQAPLNLNPDPSKTKGDTHPVDSVSTADVDLWVDSLNRLSEVGDPVLAEIIPQFKKGDRFTLPTNAQWEFVVRGRGQFNDKYHFGNNKKAVDDYAWTDNNSLNMSHPVGEKKPLIVDKKKFYDMHGNVWEIMRDYYINDPQGGIDPFVNNPSEQRRAIRGGSWNFMPDSSSSSSRRSYGEHVKRNDVGFRLIREVHP